MAVIIKSYPQLLKKIQQEIIEGKNRVEASSSQERAMMFWRIGKRISEFQLGNQERAEYGDQLFIRLSANLDIGMRTLYRAVFLYQEYPILSAPTKSSPNLGWNNYSILMTVKDPETRKQYEKKIVKEDLSGRELIALIKKDRAKKNKKKQAALIQKGQNPQKIESAPQLNQLPTSQIGQPYSYQVVDLRGRKMIDCGFSVTHPATYIEAPADNALIVGDIIQIQKKGKGSRNKYSKKEHLQKSQLYTYTAYIDRIVDGDTLWANIDLGFDIWIRQKLRLRGIDTPEMDTAQGRKAKQWVEERLRTNQGIMIKTYKSDKYDRYLSDVYYGGVFLNQELVDQGMAGVI